MPTKRSGMAGAVSNGRIYVIGGGNRTTILSTNEAYNPGSNTWTTLTPMPTARVGACAEAVGSTIHVLGGTAPGST